MNNNQMMSLTGSLGQARGGSLERERTNLMLPTGPQSNPKKIEKGLGSARKKHQSRPPPPNASSD